MSRNHALLIEINESDDLKVAPFHPNMSTTGTPTWIWEVVVDNRLFVRAYSGTSSRWYQAARAQRAGKILASGKEFNVRFAVISEPLLNDKIDQAYLKNTPLAHMFLQWSAHGLDRLRLRSSQPDAVCLYAPVYSNSMNVMEIQDLIFLWRNI